MGSPFLPKRKEQAPYEPAPFGGGIYSAKRRLTAPMHFLVYILNSIQFAQMCNTK
jgi:hypothetical protein